MPHPSAFFKYPKTYFLNWLGIFRAWFLDCLKAVLKKLLKVFVRKALNHALSWITSSWKKSQKFFFFVFFNNFSLFVIDVVFVSTNRQALLTFIDRNSVNNIYQKMVNVAVLCNVVLTSSKIIHHFENSQLSFTWHKMTSIVPQVSLSYQFYSPHPHRKYATPGIPNKIGLVVI